MERKKGTDDTRIITVDSDGDDDDDNEADDYEDDDAAETTSSDNLDSGCFEFSIGVEKVEEVRALKKKVEELFRVTVEQDIKAQEMGDRRVERQWFKIVGPLENCRQAKVFILASCDPGEAAIFDFDPRLYQQLSGEAQKREIEKLSNTVLLFDSSSEGNVVIQGVDEMSVLLAMSLLEAAVYEASTAQKSADKEQRVMIDWNIGDDRVTSHGGQVSRSSSIQAESVFEAMDVDVADMDVMKSDNPEIQRLIRLGRDKNYKDSDIREVLEKSGSVPRASDFFRALHTCRNLRLNGAFSTDQSKQKDELSATLKKGTSDGDAIFQKPFTGKAGGKTLSSASSADDVLHRSIGGKKYNENIVSTAWEPSSDYYIDCDSLDDLSLSRNETLPVQKQPNSARYEEPVLDLMNISDSEERMRKVDANQELNQKLFLEQMSKQTGIKNVACHKSSSSSDIIMSDSGADSVCASPSGRKRRNKKKKKKPTVINLVEEDEKEEYRSRSPLKAGDQVVLKEQSVVKYCEPEKPASVVRTSKIQAVPSPVNGVPLSNFNSQGHSDVLRLFGTSPGFHQKTYVPFSFPPPAFVPTVTPHSSQHTESRELCYIVIDGSNVAMSHGNGKVFSCRGIQIAVEHFRQRGHKEITVFVPQWRRQAPRYDDNNPIRDQKILEDLKDEGIMNFTPSRRIPGKKNIVCYDDRFILRLAQDTQGVVLSNDNYRDLYLEKAEWKQIIETRVLSFTFVGDRFMLPDDPLGRDGPCLDEFLSARRPPIACVPSHFNRGTLLRPPPAPSSRVPSGHYQIDSVQPMNHFYPQVGLVGQRPSVVNVNKTNMPSNQNAGQWAGTSHVNECEEWTDKINHSLPLARPTMNNRWPFSTAVGKPAAAYPEHAQYMLTRAPGMQQRASAIPSATYQAPPRYIIERAPNMVKSIPIAGSPHKQPGTSHQKQVDFGSSGKKRSDKETKEIRDRLMEIFPTEDEKINNLLFRDNSETNLEKLTNLLLTEMEGI